MGYAMPMDEINQNVLRMIKASDVGKMLSSADMALLETELETVPAQRVGGWLGEQIAKAARQQMAKGDFTGHPFRGNQWSDSSGAGSGGASGSAVGRNPRDQGDSLSVASANQALAIRGERGVLFDGLKLAMKGGFDDDPKAMKLLSRAEEYGIDTKAGKDAIGDLVDHLENENQHTFAEAANRVLNPRSGSSDEADGSDKGPDKATRQANNERDALREADKKKIDDLAARQRQQREASRQGKVKIDQDNIDAPLKAEEAAEYKAQHKDAVKALKATTSLISKLRVAANDLPKKFRDAAFMELQQAVDDTDRWADNLKSAGTKPTIRGAVKMSYVGMNIGESVKGSIRVAMEEINSGRKADGQRLFKFDSLDDSALQDASDRNFGVNDSKYDTEGAMDIIDGE